MIYVVFSLAGFLFPVDQPWYNSLAKPVWTPDGSTIGIVWGLLYGLIAFSVTYAGVKHGFKQLGITFWSIFLFNYLTNQLFSYLQFELKDLLLAAFDTTLVALSSLILIVFFTKWEKISGLLLIPYLLWSLFATFLAFSIYLKNPGQTTLPWF